VNDTPASPQLSEFEQEVERNYRFNFIVNAADGATYWFGYSFIAPTIILPLYISHFTDNPLIIGLIPFIATAGFLLPQLFTSNFVERAPRKKFFPVNVGLFTERIPVFLLALSAALFAKDQPILALVLFLAIYTWYNFGAGMIVVGWQEMIAKIIPTRRRGRFIGITNFVGNAAGILGALAVPFVLEKFTFPQGYVYIFFTAAGLIFLSWCFLAMAREPVLNVQKPHISQLEYLRSLPEVVGHDKNFLRYLLFQIFYNLSGMAGGFLIVYSARHWNLPDSVAGIYGIVMQAGQACAYLLFGFLADRKGHRFNLEAAALINLVSFILPIFAPSPIWFYPIFFLRGVAFAAAFISSIAIVMEFTQPKNRPTYIGLANTIPGVAGSIAPLLGGWLATATGYPILFLLSAVIGLIAFVLVRWMVADPRHQGMAIAPVRPGEDVSSDTELNIVENAASGAAPMAVKEV
jgi:MFS family permease